MTGLSVGSTIILSSEPRGVFLGGIVSGTPKPGTCMTITTAEPVNERHTWEAFNRDADGNRANWGVLLDDFIQGLDNDTAYVDGTHCQIYFPAKGESLLMLVANIAGTGDAFAIGDYMIIDDGTGKLIATTGSPEEEPFQVMETVAALTADTLVHCMYSGN